ncbi:MAG: hypothetical protein ACHQXA_03430 [Gemmatimonadales bacterium]
MSGDELELKAVVPDPSALRAALGAAGASLVWRGMMHDRRYDRGGELAARDEVLRARVLRDISGLLAGGGHSELTWKGPTRRSPEGYKVRRELELPLGGDADPGVLLEALGYRVVHAIDRWIEQHDLAGAMVRLEWYPRMDILVEIEGRPDAIERAIAASGIARIAFSADALAEFVARYQQARGRPAALALDELDGERPAWEVM